jgi:hypothetical protein
MPPMGARNLRKIRVRLNVVSIPSRTESNLYGREPI